MNHDELARDLAGYLRTDQRMTWCDMQLGPMNSPRPDVFTLFRSYSRPCPTAYEVKVSMSDFRADVTAGKWQTYLQFAGGVYFACEDGLLSKADVPTHCGLIVRKAAVWRITKKPVFSPVIIPQDAFMKLVIDGPQREGPPTRLRGLSESQAHEKISKKLGERVAKFLRDSASAEWELHESERHAKRIEEAAHQRAAEIRKEAEAIDPMRAELAEILSLDKQASVWQIRRAVAEFRRQQEEHPAVSNLATLTRLLENALYQYGHKTDKDRMEVSA